MTPSSRAVPYRNNIDELAEAAGVAYLLTQDLSFIDDSAIRASNDDDDQVRPIVVLEATDSNQPEETAGDGTWDVVITITLRSNADDTTKDQHRERAGELFSVFMADMRTTADLISAAAGDFHVQLLVPQGKMTTRTDRGWESTLQMLWRGCCGSDLV